MGIARVAIILNKDNNMLKLIEINGIECHRMPLSVTELLAFAGPFFEPVCESYEVFCDLISSLKPNPNLG